MEISKIFDDFANGVYDSLITAPIALGDFIARGTGIRDWQLGTGTYYMEQAKQETDILWSVLVENKGEARDIALDMLSKEINEKPAYFFGGLLVGIEANLAIANNALKAAITISLTAAKADDIIHKAINENPELYDLFSEMGLLDLITNKDVGSKILENKDSIIEAIDNIDEIIEQKEAEEVNHDQIDEVDDSENNVEELIEQQENANNYENSYGLVDLAKQNVSLYNQNINQSYNDIMGFLFS